MGKRKFDKDQTTTSKKSKTEAHKNGDKVDDDQPQSENDADVKEKTLNRYGFDIKHFRKELVAKQGQTMALTQFLQVCLNPDNDVDYLLEYLKTGGNCHEILRQINQESKKNLSLATPIFHLFHLVILKVQSSLPHMITITEEACRYFLNTFMSTVEIMISENSGPRHRKIILKLLTSMVTLNPDLGVEVLNQAPLTPKHLQHIVEKSNYKEKDNVRTSFLHFMTSFLVDGHLPLIKALLEKQGLLGLVIPGLLHDEAEAVLMFLNILKNNVIDNNFISKSLKLKTFSHQMLHNMFKVFSWKGPQEQSQDLKNTLKPEIMSLLSKIILTLFTSNRLGLYFVDNSLGTADANKNQNLYKALLTLKRPWENEIECEVILQIVYKCPDLHRAIVNVIEHGFEPQHSPIWEKSTDFTIKLLNKLKPEEFVSRLAILSPTQVANFVRFITLPVPLLKFIQTNLGKDQTISVYCVKVLVKMLQTLRRYLQILDMHESETQTSDLRNKLEYFFPKHLPAPTAIVSLIQNITEKKINDESTPGYKLPKINDTDALIYLLDLLLLYNDIHPAYFETLEGNIDMKNILDFSMTLTEGHTALLKFKIVSLWLTLDSTAISLKNPMFKDLFLIMLDVYMCDDDSTWVEAKETLRNFFKNTTIFETDEDEIHLILYTLRKTKVSPPSLIGDIVEYILENFKDLTEYVRSQLVNFEISNENSEACLEKLFNDLMEDRSTEDSVFLENKMPSPFIVGCMQYLQSNKEVKKNLKHFLCSYVANLLHSNYCPELTEVLIGDSKLDVRNYVANWIGHSVPLPPDILDTDTVLKSISKSVIDNEEFTLIDVFPYLEQATVEESVIIVNDIPYKVDISKAVDTSELLIWAKYLIFCTVRLSNMDQLKEEQQKKISDFFLCIITIGKSYHMVDACRTIILTLFKNPHVLKIYKPLDLNKGEANLLTTKFLLKVITEHKEIVKNLENKHRLLKSYQKKNYNEIVKALIKMNKRKNVNSDHTINVLEIVGLAKEDDLRVFNHIFSADMDSCFRDDKEPSLVLELLRTLIEKYSKLTKIELQPHILKKSLKLYTDLITNKETNCNLNKLEDSLAQYFEYKPHQVSRVPEDIFKQFFYANSIRKSTAHLASVLLKFGAKFCNIFKEQIKRAEILSQRELTLPLGVAVLNHKQFILENKEFLQTIYNEYKSNIGKFLEKPHKAGQIYISSWKFINKLALECMGIEESEKLFNKAHKFETVEISHVYVLQNIFLRICITDKIKIDYLTNYLLSILHITNIALKESKEATVINNLLLTIHTVTQTCKDIDNLKTEKNDDFKRLIESSTWQNFCKCVLKDSLKVKTADQGYTCGPQLLSLLTNLVKLFYHQDHTDIVTLFDMVTSHSEFLNVMLSYHSMDIKSRLLEFLYTLIRINKSVMKSQQIPVYLSAYHATRTPCDRIIVKILYFYESNGQPVNEYKPYVFGDSAANHYAVRKNRSSSLWAHPTPNQVLNLFERDIIDRTVRNFPVTQKLEYNYELPLNVDLILDGSFKSALNKLSKDGNFKVAKDTETAVKNLILKERHNKLVVENKDVDVVAISNLDVDDGIYDPVFVLPLFSHLLAPGSVASCFKLLRTGLLSVPVMALSSQCALMRAAAYHVLHRFCMLLETETRHKNDKLFLNDFIKTLHQSLSTAIFNAENNTDELGDLKNPRLPAIDALYLARALMVSTAPADPLYKPVNNFLIAKQFVDLSLVPDFLSLFHDSDIESIERRIWVLDIIRDGTKTLTDVNVVFKTMSLKMIMDFYNSVLSDRKVKERILNVLGSLVAIPRAFEILVEGYGLLSWLHGVARQLGKDDKILIRSIYSLINNMMHSMLLSSFAKNIAARKNVNKNGKTHDIIDLKTNRDIENELLVILYDLLRHVDCMDVEDVLTYVRTYRLISKRVIKNSSKKEMITFVSRVSNVCKCESVHLLTKALVTNDSAVLKSKNLVQIETDDKIRLMNELTAFVQMYLV